MKSILGHSDEVDADLAADEIIEMCRARLDGERPKGGMLFSSVEYEHTRLLERIADEWPDLPLVGGSSDGELSSTLGFRHDSVLLTLFAGDDIEVRAGLGRDLSADIESAGRQALVGAGDAPGICMTVFAPTTNSSEVIRVLNRELTERIPVVGGLTGHHRASDSHIVEFFGREVLSDSLPALFLTGAFHRGWGVGSGWFPIGAERRITRSDGHIVHSIDGKPALEIYREQYGVVPDSSLGEYPLAIYDGDGDSWSLRAIMDSDHETGSLRFAGEVPQGARVRMTEVMPDGILGGSTESLRNALEAYTGTEPQLALIFSCAARKWVLGTQAKQEIEDLERCASELGFPDLQIAGLYCFGEISPHNGGTESAFHNETCVSVVLGR